MLSVTNGMESQDGRRSRASYAHDQRLAVGTDVRTLRVWRKWRRHCLHRTDDRGGVSYGTYQLSSNAGTLREYLNQSRYGSEFQGLTPATPAFNTRWRDVARE